MISFQGVDHREEFHSWRNRPNCLERRGRVESRPDDVVVEDREIHTQTNVTVFLHCYHDRMNPRCWSSHLPDNFLLLEMVQLFLQFWQKGL